MAYNEFDDNDDIGGNIENGENDAQESPEMPDFTKESSTSTIMGEINKILMTPRFDGDACVILSMPESTIKKAKNKLNYALWKVYHKRMNPGFGMFEILCAIESMLDAKKLNAMLDNDVKLQIAKEKNINISVEELDYLVKHPYIPEDNEKKIIMCPDCHGTGINHQTGEDCETCQGEGKVMVVEDDTIPEEEDLTDEEFTKMLEDAAEEDEENEQI